MTGASTKERRDWDTETQRHTHREEGYVTMEAETGVMYLQTKEFLGLLGSSRS